MARFESFPRNNTRANRGSNIERNSVGGGKTPEPATSASLERKEKALEFDNISFEARFNRQGDLVKYRSSEFGRKEIILADGQDSLRSFFAGDPYTVRVIRDTNPGDPSKGSYIVELVIDPDQAEREEGRKNKEAQLERAKHIRQSPSLRTVLELLNEDPDLGAEYRAVAERSKEYRDLMHKAPSERQRNFTGMFAALTMSPRGNVLLNEAINRSVTERSSLLKNKMKSGAEQLLPRVRGVVIAAGVHAATMASTRQIYMPTSPDLTLDGRSSIGGQFAQYEGDVHRLNSRNRRELLDKPHLPGTEQSLNTFGRNAVLQPSDIGHEAYSSQKTIADPARVNLFLAGEPVVDAEVRRISKDPASEGLLVESFDRKTGRIYQVSTRRVTFATGIGKEVSRLEVRDKETREILAEQKKLFEEGGDVRVLSFGQFGTKMAAKDNPFPMRGMNTLILSGSGDSANVIAGIALGYEMQIGKTASQLDSVKEIIWIGQKIESKEEFLRKSRARYAQVGLDFPREQFEGYYHRIKPVPDARSRKLQRLPDGSIRVIMGPSIDAQIENDIPSNDERYVDGDFFVYAHGFQDVTNDIIAPAYLSRSYGPQSSEFGVALNEFAAQPRRYRGSQIFYSNSAGNPYQRIEILPAEVEADPSELRVGFLAFNGSYEEKTVPTTFFNRSSEFLNPRLVEKIEFMETGFQGGAADTVAARERDFIDDKGTTIAKQFQIPGRSAFGPIGTVYKVGPVSDLPLTEEERREAPALELISENTAAMFRYNKYVEEFARMMAREDIVRYGSGPDRFFPQERQQEKNILPQIDGRGIALSSFEVSFKNKETRVVGLEENSSDLLKLAVGDVLSAYTFPKDLESIKLTVRRAPDVIKKEVAYTVDIEPRLPQGYGGALSQLLLDPLVGGVLNKVTANSTSNAVEITIPVDQGEVHGAKVSYTIPRRTSVKSSR